MIEAREITRDTLIAILDLAVHDTQTRLVASNAVTVAQAHFEPDGLVRGLWSGEVAVGLFAMIDMFPDHPDARPDDPPNAACLWRLMIDRNHQRRGYGTRAMGLVMAQARAWGRSTLCLGVAQQPGNAERFYRRFGLVPTGEVEDGEMFWAGPVPPA